MKSNNSKSQTGQKTKPNNTHTYLLDEGGGDVGLDVRQEVGVQGVGPGLSLVDLDVNEGEAELGHEGEHASGDLGSRGAQGLGHDGNEHLGAGELGHVGISHVALLDQDLVRLLANLTALGVRDLDL